MSGQSGSIRVLATPERLREAGPSPDLVIVVDVLRAGTSVAHALDAGARGILPVETVEEAGRLAAALDRGSTVLGGERDSRRIEGFDLGNSPGEYTPDAVKGKAIVFTTTNGASALVAASGAKECVAASLVTRAACARRAATADRILIACAGQGGHFALEDFLCAGMIVEEILRAASARFRLHDGARAALDICRGRDHDLLGTLQGTDHGRELLEMGFGQDLALACRLDRFPFVPVLRDGRLVAEDSAVPAPPR